MDFTLRAARLNDIAAMHAIRLAVRENKLSARTGITAASYQPYVRNGTAWVAEHGATLLGFAAADAADASVWALFVAPDAEAMGIGRALHDAMLDWAASQNITHLSLATAAGTRAEGFYTRLGWRALGHDEQGQMRFDRVTRR
jgi:GNAT superfamily N-acetyltransferase